MNNIFTQNNYDLGESSLVGGSKGDVDKSFTQGQFHTDTVCLVCGNTAKYQLIPKKEKYNTAEIQDKGFVCEHCLSIKAIDPTRFGVRSI